MKRVLGVFLVMLWLVSVTAGMVRAQQANGITSPRDNAEVGGVVLVEGTATHPQFLRYELAFFKEFDPLGDWVVFASGETPIVNGVLATWDTTVGRDAGAPFYPDGTYRLRLRVVHQDSNYDEHYILGISLSNDEPTPTPSVTPDGAPEETGTPEATFAIVVPTELPTLTPFPTTTSRPTADAGEAETVENSEGTEGSSNLPFGLEGEFSGDQIKGGLFLGIRITLACFVGLAAYLGLRLGLRWVLTRVRSLDIPSRFRD